MDLHDAVALVTGGGTRIGRQISLALAAGGASVAVHYRSSLEGAESTAREICDAGGNAHCFRADFIIPGDVDALVPAVIEHFGGLHILVNSASVYHAVPMAQTDRAEWDENMTVHGWAPFRLSQLMLAGLGERPGKIVNIVDARLTRPGHFAYGLSKATLSALTRSLAGAAGPNVQVNELALGAILPPTGWDEDRRQSVSDRIPARRWGSAEEVAQAVVALLKNDFINAGTLVVDGGETGTRK